MKTRKWHIPVLLLALWLIATTLTPYSYAADNTTHRVEVKSGTGYISDAVGINVWESGIARDITFTPVDGYVMHSLSASCDGNTVNTLLKDQPTLLSIGNAVLPLRYVDRRVIITVPDSFTANLTLSATAESASYRVNLSADNGIETSGGGVYGVGKYVTVTAMPTGEAKITRIQVTQTDTGPANTTDITDKMVTVNGKQYPFSVSDNKVTLTFPAEENVDIHFFSNGKPGELPMLIHTSGDKGTDIDSSCVKVKRGKDIAIHAKEKRGYEITEVRIEDETHTATGYVSEGRIWLSGKVYQLEQNNNRVILLLTDIQSDMRVHFLSQLDEDNIPVTVSEGTGVEIDMNCSDTVPKGTDAIFTISPKKNYKLNRISLSINDISHTVDADENKIRVDGTAYQLQQDGDCILLYVNDIYAPIRVSATGTRLSSYDNHVDIGTQQNCSITTSQIGVNNGGSVTYTVTPNEGYELSTVTLRTGNRQTTASANADAINIGNNSYKMVLSSSGVLRVTITDIHDYVQLSAYATYNGAGKLYLRNGITEPYFKGMGDGHFYAENPLTRAEAIVMLARLTNYSSLNEYPSCNAADVPINAWYSHEVNAFYDAGIIAGPYFYPNDNISREDLAVWLYRLSGSPYVDPSTTVFLDVPIYTDIHDAVAYGHLHGWIDGYHDGTFRPNNPITRAETAKLINRVTNRTLKIAIAENTFSDVPAWHWAYLDILSAANITI